MREMKKIKVAAIGFLVLLISLSSVAITSSVNSNAAKLDKTNQGNAMTKVYIYPRRVSYPKLGVGETFIVNVRADNIDNIYAYQFKLKYNPEILEFVSVGSGFLNSPAFAFKKTDAPSGVIMYAVSSMYPAGPKTEDGILATITFKVKGIGTSDLDIFGEGLFDSNIKSIRHIVNDGNFSNEPDEAGPEEEEVAIIGEQNIESFEQFSYEEQVNLNEIQTSIGYAEMTAGYTGMTAYQTESCHDADIDSYFAEGQACGTLLDCVDSDPMVYTGRAEICDRKDNDCDSRVDEPYPDLCYPGDVVHDYGVNITDLAWIGKTYGSVMGQERYQSCVDQGNYCDLNEDGKIDVFDLFKIGKNFWKTYLSGCVDVTVKFYNGDPIMGAEVSVIGGQSLGLTNSAGQVTRCGLLSQGDYQVKAVYGGTEYGKETGYPLSVDGSGNGMTVIDGSGCTIILVEDEGVPLPNMNIWIDGPDCNWWFQRPTNSKGVTQDCSCNEHLQPGPHDANAYYPNDAPFGAVDFVVYPSCSAFERANVYQGDTLCPW